jgi:histidinol-phosphatase
LQSAFPDHAFIGEEAGSYISPISSDYVWTIDPIDGTVGFAHGVPLAGIIVALQYRGEAVVSVMDVPELNWSFSAMKGNGSYHNGQRLSVGRGFDPNRDVVCHGDRYTFDLSGFGEWYDHLASPLKFFRSYTDVFGHCLVARGSAALVIDAAMERWEYAGAELLIREAGGVRIVAKAKTDPNLCAMIAGRPEAVRWAWERLGDLWPGETA